MTILALDTSNKTLSVAVELTDGTIIEQTIENTLQHSVLLMPTIEAVFKEAGISAKDLTKVLLLKDQVLIQVFELVLPLQKHLRRVWGFHLLASPVSTSFTDPCF